jgi:hypothetical protein
MGAEAGSALPPTPYEYWYAAEPVSAAGEHDRAIEIASEGLAHWPSHPLLHYQLACYNALGGHRAEAVAHLRIAHREDPRTREWAADDADLSSVREDRELTDTSSDRGPTRATARPDGVRVRSCVASKKQRAVVGSPALSRTPVGLLEAGCP